MQFQPRSEKKYPKQKCSWHPSKALPLAYSSFGKNRSICLPSIFQERILVHLVINALETHFSQMRRIKKQGWIRRKCHYLRVQVFRQRSAHSRHVSDSPAHEDCLHEITLGRLRRPKVACLCSPRSSLRSWLHTGPVQAPSAPYFERYLSTRSNPS